MAVSRGVQIILSWAHSRALTCVNGFKSPSLNTAIHGRPWLEWLSTDAVLRKRLAKAHCSVDISKRSSSPHTHTHTQGATIIVWRARVFWTHINE